MKIFGLIVVFTVIQLVVSQLEDIPESFPEFKYVHDEISEYDGAPATCPITSSTNIVYSTVSG